MAASPDEAVAQLATNNGGVKREYPYSEERGDRDPRNGSGDPTTNSTGALPFTSILEGVMSHSHSRNNNHGMTLAQSLSHSRSSNALAQSSAEDLSLLNPSPSVTAAAALAHARSVIQRAKNGAAGNTASAASNGNGLGSASTGNGTGQNGVNSAAANQAAAIAESESEHKCPHCLIVYPDNVMYLLHKMLHSKNSNQPYRCNICFNNYPNRYEFYAHVVNHRQ